MSSLNTVLVTGGGGYVGSVLVPKLLQCGYAVKVYDLFLYGEDVFDSHKGNANLKLVKGDIRDTNLLAECFVDCDAVIHLACISNDPSFELNPSLGKSINFDAFEPMVKAAKEAGVKRFIYASSSSVYGIKTEEMVTEDLPLEPLTDYSKFKAMCEEVLSQYQSDEFTTLTVRPATVCGYSPRQRLDLVVNILTNHAYHNRKIKVFGGEQYRPNIHIEDMADFYVNALQWPSEKINGKIYNVGLQDHTVTDLANIVKKVVGSDVDLEFVPTDDDRSYRVTSEKIKNELGFEPKRSIEDAVSDLHSELKKVEFSDSMSNPLYFNIKLMQEVDLT